MIFVLLVSGRHTQAGESGGENQESSQHQEMAGGETRNAVLEKCRMKTIF